MFWIQYKVNIIAFHIDRVFTQKCILDFCAFTATTSVAIPTHDVFRKTRLCRDNVEKIKSWQVFYSSWGCQIIDRGSYKRDLDNKLKEHFIHIAGIKKAVENRWEHRQEWKFFIWKLGLNEW